MKYKFKLVFISLLLSSNILAFNYDAEINKIVKDYLKYEKKKRDIYAFGVGGGALGEVSSIGLFLHCQKKVNMDQARNLFIESLVELLNRINQNKSIRPYLHNFPFGPGEGLHFNLSFVEKNERPVSHGYIAVVSIVLDTLCYYTYDYTTEKFILQYDEPYEEALKIYNQSILTQKGL